jgi:hypothetical protein
MSNSFESSEYDVDIETLEFQNVNDQFARLATKL